MAERILAKTHLLTQGRILVRDGEPVVMYVYGTRENIEESIEYKFVCEVTDRERDKDYVKVI